MASLGVAKWIALLEDIPVNPSPLQENRRERMTQGTFGLISPEFVEKSSQNGAFSRMSKTISSSDFEMFGMSYNEWVTKLRQEYSQRKKLAHHINEDGSLSWRTPSASDGEGGVKWFDDPKYAEAEAPKIKLRDQSANWPTPQSRDWKGESGRSIKGQEEDLPHKAKYWAPCGSDQWLTPTATDGGAIQPRSPEEMIRKDGRNVLRHSGLAEQTLRDPSYPQTKQELEKWMTPTTRDWKDTGIGETPTNSLLGRQAPRAMNGIAKNRRLNQRFAEWLMGWIPGWTDPYTPIELSDYEQWETASSQLLLRLLSLHSQKS